MSRQHVNAIVKAFDQFRHRHTIWQVWQDFIELAAIAMSRVDLAQAEARERRYLEVVKRYAPEEQTAFAHIFAEVIHALEEEPADILGAAFMALELGNKWTGQFFTPQALCDMMAAMTFDDSIKETIGQQGYFRMHEPAVGGGALVIGTAKALLAQEINYQRHMHVTAVDVDIKAVHMAYVQFSLLHIPAVIVHGNALSGEEWSHWFTPAHILGGWRYRLKTKHSGGEIPFDESRPEDFVLPAAGKSGPQMDLFGVPA